MVGSEGSPAAALNLAGGETTLITKAFFNVAVAVVYAALRSIETNGQAVRIADVFADAHARVAERMSHVA